MLFLLLSLLAVQTPAPAPTPEAHARAVIASLVAGDYAAIESQYGDQLKAALPPGALRASWTTSAPQLGAYQGITDVKTQPVTAAGIAIVVATCRFANYDLPIRLGFDAAGRIVAFASLAPVSRATWSPPPYADPSAFDARPVTLHTGHWDLPGIVTAPRSAGPHPAIVLVHGSGPNDINESIGPNRMFEDLAEGLASKGVVVLRYEKRTHKYGVKSSDDPAAFTVKDEEMDDADTGVALLAGMPDVDASRIFVAGHSEGGYLAPRIAARNRAVKGVILLAGNVRSLADAIVDQVQYQAKQAGAMTPQIQQAIDAANRSAAELNDPNLKRGMTVHVLGSPLPASYVLDLRTYHPAETAAALTIPILVLQGERDYQVTMVDFGLWHRALDGHPNITFRSYPGLNHFFFSGTGPSMPGEYLTPSHVDAAVVADIAAWCARK